MSTPTMSAVNGTGRAAVVRAAQGRPAVPAQRVPMGIRVTAGPGAVTTPSERDLAEAGVRPAMAGGADMVPASTEADLAKAGVRAAMAGAQAERSVEDLLAQARASGAARTRTLAGRITDLIEDLAARVEAEEKRRQAAAELEKQRRELAAQEEKLARELQQVRQRLRSRPATADSPAAPGRARQQAQQRAAIRAWAVANGHEVADRGRIPQDVVQAWAVATGSEVIR